MKTKSWLLAVILLLVSFIFAGTTIYGWEWFGKSKEVQKTPITTKMPTPQTTLRPSPPPPSNSTYCANAYQRMKEALDAATSTGVRPFYEIRYIVGETGGANMSCFIEDSSSDLVKITSGGDSDLGKCLAGSTSSDWPRSCFHPRKIGEEFANTADGLTSNGWTYDLIMSPDQLINQVGNLRYRGWYNFPLRLPYFWIGPHGGASLRGALSDMMVFRAVAGYETALEASRLMGSEEKWLVCFDKNLQDFESACR